MKIKFFIDRKSFFGRTAITSAVLAVLFRLIGSIGFWADKTYLRFGLLLPVCACLLFALSVFFLGKKAFWTSAAGVLAGAVFFIYRLLHEDALGDEFIIHDSTGTFSNELWTALFIAAYIIIAVIYILTVFSAIKTKWVIAALFFIPFAAHLYYDYTILANRSIAVSAASMMNELSVLTVLCGAFFASVGLKKAYKVLSGQTVAPPVPGDSLSGAKPAETAAETVPDQNPADAAGEAAQTAADIQAESAVAEAVSAAEEAAIIAEGAEEDTGSLEENCESVSGQDEPSLEERLNDLPDSGPLTLDPIVPSKAEEAEDEMPEDAPQGGDEPERRDAIAPKKGLGKFFSK